MRRGVGTRLLPGITVRLHKVEWRRSRGAAAIVAQHSTLRASLRDGWVGLALAALAVGTYALAVLAVDGLGPPFVRERRALVPWAVVAHLGGGALSLIAGAFQVNGGLRARFLGAHRWLGRVYVVAVAAGGTSGLVLALLSQGGLAAHAGFALLAVLWLVTTGAAYRYVCRGDRASHRRCSSDLEDLLRPARED